MKCGRLLGIFSFFLLLSLSLPWTAALQRDDSQLRQEEALDYFERWLKEDVVYIISDEERAVFRSLTTPEEKEQFIEQFWHRRNPDPRSPYNAFKEEHYRRIAYANERFTSGDPGWLTDRGRIYIMFGEPDSIVSRPTGGTYVRTIREGGGVTAAYPFEIWRYRHIEGIGDDIELEFVDTTYSGKFQLAVFPWEKDVAMHSPGVGRTLAEQTGLSTRAERPGLMPAAGGAQYNPQEMFASRTRDTPFARYELQAKVSAPPIVKYHDLKQLVDVNIHYADLPFEYRGHYFRLNESQALVPFTLQVPNKELTFEREGDLYVARMALYGIVTSMTNRIVTEFEDTLTVRYRPENLEEGRARLAMYQKILTLETRTRYRLDLVLRDLHSGKTGVAQTGIIPPSFQGGELQGSSLILSNSIRPLDEIPTRNDMFVLGDVQVLPNMQKEFTPQMPLGIYYQVYNAAIDQATLSPSLEVHFNLLKDGELIRTFPDENGQSLQFFSDRRVVILQNLSLAELEPGRYQVEIQVIDRLTGQRVETQEDFRIIEDARLTASR